MSISSTGRHQLLTPTERDVPPTMKQEAQLPSLPRRRKEDFLLELKEQAIPRKTLGERRRWPADDAAGRAAAWKRKAAVPPTM